MSTRIGIVGLPNAGKSSLFNALTKAGAEAANYPFTTIEPNVAVVPVRDRRLDEVAATVGASELVYDTIDFHDIAGPVPRADLERAGRRLDRAVRPARGGDRVAVAEETWLGEVIAALQAGRPVRGVPLPADAPNAARDLGSLTAKPVLFVANVDEGAEEIP